MIAYPLPFARDTIIFLCVVRAQLRTVAFYTPGFSFAVYTESLVVTEFTIIFYFIVHAVLFLIILTGRTHWTLL